MSDNPFNLVGQGEPVTQVSGSNLNEKIESLLASSDVFLFMKGTPRMPQCGFSANVVQILTELGVNYKTFNILEDMEIRQGLKEWSNWPTYPQLYFKGKLIGGNDIIMEMFQSGDLPKVLS